MDIKQYNALVGSAAAEFSLTGLDAALFFPWAIRKQNTIYELPINHSPTLHGLGEPASKRMSGFLKTLKKEMDEGRDIAAYIRVYEEVAGTTNEGLLQRTEDLAAELRAHDGEFTAEHATKLAEVATDFISKVPDEHLGVSEAFEQFILVALADWLADMNVYNRSEGLKYGLPLESVQNVVMGSNFTKLGEDGLPIKDENGKFLKGPNFIPPEAHIHATLFGAVALMDEVSNKEYELELIQAVALPTLDNPMMEVISAAEVAENEELVEDYDSDEDYVE